MALQPSSRQRLRLFAASNESAEETIAQSRVGGMTYWRGRLSGDAMAAGENAYVKQMEVLQIEPKAFLSLDDAGVYQWCRVAVERINRPS